MNSGAILEWIQDYAFDKFDETFTDNIPIEAIKGQPWFFKYPLGALSMAGMLAALGYHTSKNYAESAGSSYISISNTGTDSCLAVPRPLTGKYLSSYGGFWEGSTEFNYNESMYQFGFSNFNNFENPSYVTFYNKDLNICDFGCLMRVIENKTFGVYSSYYATTPQPLAISLLIWMNYVGTVETGSYKQTFTFAATHDAVFNRPILWSTLSSAAQGNCPVYSSAFFDPSTATYHVSFNYGEYMSAQCNILLDPQDNGHNVVIPSTDRKRSRSRSRKLSVSDMVANSIPKISRSSISGNGMTPQENSILPTTIPIFEPTFEPTSEPTPSAGSSNSLVTSIANTYRISMDMRAIALAMAVNLGAIDLSSMEAIGGKLLQFQSILQNFGILDWFTTDFYIQVRKKQRYFI